MSEEKPPQPRWGLEAIVMVQGRPSWGMGVVQDQRWVKVAPHRPGSPVGHHGGQFIYSIGPGDKDHWESLVTFKSPKPSAIPPELPPEEGEWIREEVLAQGFQLEPTEYGAMIKLFMDQGVPFQHEDGEDEQRILVGGSWFQFTKGQFVRVTYDVTMGESDPRS